MVMLIAVLLAAVLAPLCFSTDGEHTDACCEMGAQIAAAGWMQSTLGGLGAMLVAAAVALGAAFGLPRLLAKVELLPTSSPALAAAPLRI